MSPPAPDWPGSAFWDFSLRVYGRPGVAAVCLALQDEHGLDVNLVLFAAWQAMLGRKLDEVPAARLGQFGEAWQADVMRPLRRARRALKGLAVEPALTPLVAERRQALAALELDLERVEQLQLAALAASEPPAGSIAGPPSDVAALLLANLAALHPGRTMPGPALAALAAALAPAGGAGGAAAKSDVLAKG